MGAYAYPININRKKETKREQRNHFISDDAVLTVKVLAGIVGNNEFSITPEEDYCGCNITVYSTRLETDEEFNNRIERHERYMREYNKRHGKN